MEELLRWGAYVITGGMAWYLKTLKDKQDTQEKAHAELKEKVLGEYVKKEDLRQIMEPVLARFDKLETLIVSHLINDKQK